MEMAVLHPTNHMANSNLVLCDNTAYTRFVFAPHQAKWLILHALIDTLQGHAVLMYLGLRHSSGQLTASAR